MSAREFDLFHPKKYGNVQVLDRLAWTVGTYRYVHIVKLHQTEVFRYCPTLRMVYLNSGGMENGHHEDCDQYSPSSTSSDGSL